MKQRMKSWLLIAQVCLALIELAQLIQCEAPSNSGAQLFCVSENCTKSIPVCNCDPSCGQRCYPLKWFVENAETIPNNSRIIFEPGDHSLSSNESYSALVILSNKENLSLIGNGSQNGKPQSRVVCTGNESGFFVQNSTNIQIAYLSFHNCGSKMNLSHDNSLYGCIFVHYSYDVTMSHVHITNCTGFGVHMDNTCGQITITNSSFYGSKGGNAVFWFKHCRQNLTQTSLVIQDSHFLYGSNAGTQNATGIYLIIMRERLQVTLRHLTLKGNKGKFGGNLAIKFTQQATHESNVTIDNCLMEEGNASSSGGGMIMWFEKTWLSSQDCPSDGRQVRMLIVKNTRFINNTAHSGGGALLTYHERLGTGCTKREVEFYNCTFENNTANTGSALQVSKHNLPRFFIHNSPQFKVKLTKSVITHNRLQPLKDQDNADGIVELFSVESFVIANSTFANNSGTALTLVNSAVQYEGDVLFWNNSAEYGGAIKLCDSSQMYINNSKETHVRLLHNRADLAGGAIYAGNQCLQQIPPCFFQVSFKNFSNIPTISELRESILYFEGNDAKYAGKAIYGGTVDYCFTDTELRVNGSNSSRPSFYNSIALFDHIFNFSNRDEPSLITSDPYGVCFCNINTNATNCHTRTLVKSLYPGEYFTVYVSAVGQTEGSVPSDILIESEGNITVNHQGTRKDRLCHTLRLSVHSPASLINENVTLKIGIKQRNAISENSNYYRIPKLRVNVTLRPCPFLFKLTSEKSCGCPEKLKAFGVNCKINTGTVKRSSETWIGCIFNETTDKCTVIEASNKCRKDRCSPANTLNRTNFTNICVKGREGRLCGNCSSNYSLSLGPLKCVRTDENCSGWILVILLLAFGVAGILLVCFLAIFNITVAEGTINGLLFYANCVHANEKAFTINDYDAPSAHFFRVFIAWLNLDLGFEVCFYSGMTAYQKIWWEFGFLLYLLVLGSVIVCLSHRYVRFTRLVGRNVVPVLATIVLMAFPKLARNSIKIWRCDDYNYWSSDNGTPLMWYLDETVDCYAWKHLLLFILSVFLCITAVLYALCLLLIQCLQRGSNLCVLRWVNKLRPFFDANAGPYRDHYRFWPGLLMLARLGVYIVHWRTDDVQLSYTTMACCVFIFFLGCVSPRGVYKKWPLNFLESSFLLNLGFSSAMLASQLHYARALSFTSIGLAAFQFLLIVAYHCYKKVSQTRKWKVLVMRIREKRSIRRANRQMIDESEPLIRPEGMPHVVKFTQPREPLLEDD